MWVQEIIVGRYSFRFGVLFLNMCLTWKVDFGAWILLVLWVLVLIWWIYSVWLQWCYEFRWTSVLEGYVLKVAQFYLDFCCFSFWCMCIVYWLNIWFTKWDFGLLLSLIWRRHWCKLVDMVIGKLYKLFCSSDVMWVWVLHLFTVFMWEKFNLFTVLFSPSSCLF